MQPCHHLPCKVAVSCVWPRAGEDLNSLPEFLGFMFGGKTSVVAKAKTSLDLFWPTEKGLLF